MTWNDAPRQDRIAHIGKTIVATPTHEKAVNVLKGAYLRYGTRPEGTCSFLLGETRSGKTTACDEFMYGVAHEIGGKIVADGRDDDDGENGGAVTSVVVARDTFLERPVIKVQVDAMPTYKALFDDVVTAVLGMKPPRSMTAAQLKATLSLQMKTQKTRLLVFDDVQHIAEHRGAEGVYKAADVFKALMKTAGVQIVLVGLPHALEIRQANRQLSEMTVQAHTVRPYDMPSDRDDDNEMIKLLVHLQAELPFDASSDISSYAVAMRIHAHTDGYIGRIAHLIIDAVEFAIDENVGMVDRSVLAGLLRDFRGIPDSHNPFLLDDEELGEAKEQERLLTVRAKQAAEKRQTQSAGLRDRRRSFGTRGG
ncbi:MAG TPA: hypothetical protein ENH55_06865 [Aurantimonas coralicida]|uniref:ORC1/DEAH AAA+ ATPase domain-containing protein n=2 Tax=root TaxID=1 RepID=A0A9C9TFW3_9HYPH|nr:hypothetical protein [Aurantimonas coralicida]HET99759.1 hypothetical protein [Aurantimonas coralicida]